MIELSKGYSVKSFTSRRTANCRNCRDTLSPGVKRVVIQIEYNRTLYLCSDCAAWEAERMEARAADLRRAVAGWIDTEAEFYARARA